LSTPAAAVRWYTPDVETDVLRVPGFPKETLDFLIEVLLLVVFDIFCFVPIILHLSYGNMSRTQINLYKVSIFHNNHYISEATTKRMNQQYKKLLEKQQYRFIGEHSAVKICGWTKKAITGEGMCYKGKFYGINSHRCIQMSPAINFCDMDCIYCWRDRNNSAFGKVDQPKQLMDKAKEVQEKLLQGFKGHKNVDKQRFQESKQPMHVAISLNGEMTYYPHLSELIQDIKRRGWSSYLVTNGQRPEVLKKIELPTQLYISLDAPNKKHMLKITKAMRKDAWKRLIESLKVMNEVKGKTRTTLRLTIIKGLNDFEPENYAKLFEIANPDFIEVKAYMWVGASQERLEIQNMPTHEEVIEFASKIAQYVDYKITDEQASSRVVLMTNKDSAPRFIDFAKLKECYLAESKKNIPGNPELDKHLSPINFVPITSIQMEQ
jgi:tRNA wybutosine-synthesizing protein 1